MATRIDGLEIDTEALQKKYNLERDRRLKLRPQGNAQYVKLEGPFAHYLDDPYTERKERAPRREDVDVAVLGGGFGGLLAAARLKEAGVNDIRIFEKGGGFGGTWYWNRYPGAMCDVESYVYLPLLEEVGYMPIEKYSSAPEILEYAHKIAEKYDLYRGVLFHTEIEELRFDERASRWIISTDRGDTIRAKFFVMASGPLQEPKLPGVPGIETFAGHSFHTSRWDYDYTGGDTMGDLSKLKDKVVGVIGTGATAIQCVPQLGKWAKQLYVFQRTPSSVDVRNNRPTDPEWVKTLTPGWQRRRITNFTAVTSGMPMQEDLVNDSWTKVIHLMMQDASADMTPEQLGELAQLADYAVMDQVRDRVGEIVKDPATAEALKPWYNRLCKRPCFHDEYLDTFNRPNVILVDTEGRGVERIGPDGIFANGQEYKLDCLVYATGFELAAFTNRAVMPVLGRGGLPLTEKWKEGATTLHGIHVHGFPNFLILSTTQSAWGSNFPHMMDEQARHIAYVISEAQERGAESVEVSAEAEAAWVAFHEQNAEFMLRIWRNCTPSYFNNEGVPSPALARDGGFGGGVLAFVDILEQWRARGDLDGLQLDSNDACRAAVSTAELSAE
jgi:cyclohexanone monooxygenase